MGWGVREQGFLQQHSVPSEPHTESENHPSRAVLSTRTPNHIKLSVFLLSLDLLRPFTPSRAAHPPHPYPCTLPAFAACAPSLPHLLRCQPTLQEAGDDLLHVGRLRAVEERRGCW